MKLSELLKKHKGDSPAELRADLNTAREELHKLKMQLASKQLSNPSRIRLVKKDIARIETILTEKQAGGKA